MSLRLTVVRDTSGERVDAAHVFGPIWFPMSRFATKGVSNDGEWGEFDAGPVCYKAMMDLTLELARRLRETGSLRRVLLRAVPKEGESVERILEESRLTPTGGLDRLLGWQLYLHVDQNDDDESLVTARMMDMLTDRHEEWNVLEKRAMSSRDAYKALRCREVMRLAFLAGSLAQDKSNVFGYGARSEDMTRAINRTYELAAILQNYTGEDLLSTNRHEHSGPEGVCALTGILPCIVERVNSLESCTDAAFQAFVVEADGGLSLDPSAPLVYQIPTDAFERRTFLRMAFPRLHVDDAIAVCSADELMEEVTELQIRVTDRATRKGRFALLEEVNERRLRELDDVEERLRFVDRRLVGMFADLWNPNSSEISRSARSVSEVLAHGFERQRYRHEYGDLTIVSDMVRLLFMLAEADFIFSNHYMWARLVVMFRCVCARGPDRRPSTILVGAAGSGKSKIVESASMTVLQDVLQPASYSSGLADFVDAPNTEYWLCQTIKMYDEMPISAYGLSLSANDAGSMQEETDQTARRKELMTKHRITTERNVSMDTREGKSFEKVVQVARNEHITLGNMNQHPAQMNEFIASRFNFMTVQNGKRADGQTRQAIMAREAGARSATAVASHTKLCNQGLEMMRQSFVEHFVVCHAQGARLLAGVDTSVWQVQQRLFQRAMRSRGSINNAERRFEDVLSIAKALTIMAATMHVFHSSASPISDALDDASTLRFKDLREVEPFLVVSTHTIEIALTVMEESFFPKPRVYVLQLLSDLLETNDPGKVERAHRDGQEYVVIDGVLSTKMDRAGATRDMWKQLCRKFSRLDRGGEMGDTIVGNELTRLTADTVNVGGHKRHPLEVMRDADSNNEWRVTVNVGLLAKVREGKYCIKAVLDDMRHPYADPGRRLLFCPYTDSAGRVHPQFPEFIDVPLHEHTCKLVQEGTANATWDAHSPAKRARMEFVEIDKARGCTCFRSKEPFCCPNPYSVNKENAADLHDAFGGDANGNATGDGAAEPDNIEVRESLTTRAFVAHMERLGMPEPLADETIEAYHPLLMAHASFGDKRNFPLNRVERRARGHVRRRGE